MVNIKIVYLLKTVIVSVGELSGRFCFFICILIYVSMGLHITAEKIFVVIFCCSILSMIMTNNVAFSISQMAEARVCLKRINDFLMAPEVETKFVTDDTIIKPGNSKILMKNCFYKLGTVNILQHINLELKRGLVILAGPTGAGKTTLLKLFLRDLSLSEGIIETDGTFSYSSQEPWLFPATVKQNILFGKPLDENRYQKVVEVCALKKDFNQFSEGDETIIIDRGLNLSRGQKARINLARSVYKHADIYLIDDSLSALDTNVSKHIFQECLKGLLKNKLCVLVCHQVQFFQDADKIVLLKDGEIEKIGTLQEISYSNLLTITEQDNEYKEDTEDEFKTAKICGSRNIYQETKKEGKVAFATYIKYFKFGGIKVLLLHIAVQFALQSSESSSEYFISNWVDLEQNISIYRSENMTDSLEYQDMVTTNGRKLELYSLFISAITLGIFLRSFIFLTFMTAASRNVHKAMLSKILKAVMFFFDTNLLGNIVNRFSKDLGSIDEVLPHHIFEGMRALFTIAGALILVSTAHPFLLIPSFIFGSLLFTIRHFYIPSSRSLKRLDGATRSPVVGHLGTSLEDLTTVRAHGARSMLHEEFDRYQDVNTSAFYMYVAMSKAFGFYLELLSVVYVAAITFSFLIFHLDAKAGKVGLALTQAFYLMRVLRWGIKQWAECENLMTSVERITEYTTISLEDNSGKAQENWPQAGKIVFQNVNLCYSSNNKPVLKDVNLVIQPKQKIGIVGRTGAGKTSLISALFRLYDTTGAILVDNVNIKDIQLRYLRSKFSLLPQDPVLFAGSIRSNLDPTNEYTDLQIWKALEEVELKQFISKLGSDLNSVVAQDGGNYSVGQRQLICLARAILRNNRILVLDEATANIDPHIEELIQKTIKTKFSGCTVLTIAHRLHTIIDSDKVIVMDSGKVIEFDNPKVLMEKNDSIFCKMTQQSACFD